MIYSIQERSERLSSQILERKTPLSAWFLTGLISTIGSIIGVTLNSGIVSAASKVYCLIGTTLGITSIAIGTELAATELCSEEEKIDPLLTLARTCRREVVEDAIKYLRQLEKIDFHLRGFASSLTYEQLEKFLSLMGEDSSLEREPIIFSKELTVSFMMTQKQSKILDAFSETFQVEKSKMKGFEILSKFITASKNDKLSEFAKVLSLKPHQQYLFEEFIDSIKEFDENTIHSMIQLFLQKNLSLKVLMHFNELNKARTIFMFATPFAALLSIINPIRVIGAIQPICAIWTLMQVATLVVGAAAVSFLFYQCFYSRRSDEIIADAHRIQLMNQKIVES
jgi:hypothetical protein